MIFTNLKPKISKIDTPNIVYKIDCSECDKTYIGQTKQYFKKEFTDINTV